MEKRHSQLEHGQPMERTGGLFCTYDSGVARCQSQHQSEFNNASARLSACLYDHYASACSIAPSD